MRFTLICILSFLAIQLRSQNYLMSDGVDAFHISGLFADAEGSKAYGFTPGYTFNGRLTVNCGIARERVDLMPIEGTSISPSVGYLILRQGALPVSIETKGGLSYSNFSDLNLTVNTLSLGGIVYHRLNLQTSFQTHLGFGASWNRSRVNAGGFVETGENYSYLISSTFMFNDWYLRPAYSFNDSTGAFLAELGYIF